MKGTYGKEETSILQLQNLNSANSLKELEGEFFPRASRMNPARPTLQLQLLSPGAEHSAKASLDFQTTKLGLVNECRFKVLSLW